MPQQVADDIQPYGLVIYNPYGLMICNPYGIDTALTELMICRNKLRMICNPLGLMIYNPLGIDTRR